MNNTDNSIFDLIRISLWNTNEQNCEVNKEMYEEMVLHSIESLPAGILNKLNLSVELRDVWKKSILQRVANSVHYKYTQASLPIEVPYVVLKGTTAAQYYPHPEYRVMGDIDIMTRREDFNTAYGQLLNNGYVIVNRLDREISFQKDGVIVELHRFFASLNNPDQSRYMDDLIINNITSSHILPDMVNGLVLLEHISQHLEHGLGLRQIIDWMMFVDKCLPDDKWDIFLPLSDRIGLRKLAIVTTRMCEMYLGLPMRNWCSNADEITCIKLMEYIMSCGNFGYKWTDDEKIDQTVFTYTKNPIAAIKWLQERGLINWNAAKKVPVLRPFAWLYQAVRYVHRGLSQQGSKVTIMKNYNEAKKRIELFNNLGVKQRAKGLVVYKDGQYKKV